MQVRAIGKLQYICVEVSHVKLNIQVSFGKGGGQNLGYGSGPRVAKQGEGYIRHRI